MIIAYTKHAEYQIKERKIHKIWVEEAVKYPDITSKTGHKYYSIKKLNGFTLVVIYEKEKYINVITTYFIK